MSCNEGRRKVFADELVERVAELAKRFGLEEVVVRREADPVLVAARGRLQDDDGRKTKERVELVLQLSPDIARAEAASLLRAEVVAAPSEVGRAFDLSESVGRDTVARAAPRPEEPRC